MRLTKTKTQITESRSVAGLFDCEINHEIKGTVATARYVGPKIPGPEWDLVLSFLKYVYDETKSEGQVRLYVNLEQQTWKAWAYPQEEGSGMTTKELDNEEAKKQREQFKDSEGWIYFGTVHSHCSASAFQSSVDEANEANQDGIHITIGHLDQKQFDMDCRFYRAKMKFEPDMSEFFDIGEPWCSASSKFVNHDAIARHLMSIPSAESVEVPEQWKDNLIKRAPYQVTQATYLRGNSFWNDEGVYANNHGQNCQCWQCRHIAERNDKEKEKSKASKKEEKKTKNDVKALERTIECAIKEVWNRCGKENVDIEELRASVEVMNDDKAARIIMCSADNHNLHPLTLLSALVDFTEAMYNAQEKEEMQQELKEAMEEAERDKREAEIQAAEDKAAAIQTGKVSTK